MMTAQNLKATHIVGETVRGVVDKVVAIDNEYMPPCFMSTPCLFLLVKHGGKVAPS
jgi:hypothetical protein